MYRYGTVGLSVFDDRTKIEKVCDRVDMVLETLNKREELRKNRSSHRWRSFFDISTGTWITGMSDIRRIEKERGLVYMDFNDISKEAKRNQQYNEERAKAYHRKEIGEKFRKLKQGYSAVKDMKERINKGQYEVGQRAAFNG
jgi:hypothetical protein